MKLSAFAPLSLMKLSGKEPDSRAIYHAMLDGFGGEVRHEYSLTPGSRLEAFAFANSLAIARARQRIKQSADQHLPWKAVEGLPHLEKELGLTPGAYDTITQRRAAATQRALLPVEANHTNISAGLAQLLGADFVAYHTVTPGSGALYPTNLGDWPMTLKRPDATRKIVVLLDTVDIVGSPKTVRVQIKPLTIDPHSFDLTMAPVVGDVFVFDVGQTGQMDRMTVTAITQTDVATYAITGVFTRPHEVGVLGFTHPIPYWISYQKDALIVVSLTAARDAEKRRLINEYMRRTATTVSTWSISAANGGNTLQFLLGSPSLGFSTLAPVAY